MVVLLLDGPDLSGKSTAIEKIGKRLNAGITLKNLFKPSKPNDEEIYRAYFDILMRTDGFDNVVLDRFFPSQAVYSILRGADEMRNINILHLEEQCVARGDIYIYLDTPLETLKERYKVRGDEHIKIEQLEMLKKRYDLYYDLCPMIKIKIDTRFAGWLDELAKFIYKNREVK